MIENLEEEYRSLMAMRKAVALAESEIKRRVAAEQEAERQASIAADAAERLRLVLQRIDKLMIDKPALRPALQRLRQVPPGPVRPTGLGARHPDGGRIVPRAEAERRWAADQ
jgi:hypothetical protein